MSTIKLNEQIAFLRKQNGITQEELAQILGVTNQSVSKWESGTCCPDIQLLPDIATYFNVSIDELIGYKSTDTIENVFLKIKALFESSPREDSFSIAYKLATLLHEGAMTNGYKKDVPWITNKNLSSKPGIGGCSICSEPEGITVNRGNSVFITDNSISQTINPTMVREVYSTLESLCNKNTLKVLFGVYELTINDFDLYVSVDDIRHKCKLSEDAVQTAIDNLPIQIKEMDNGEVLYRIEGCFMHIPSILLLFRGK